MAMDVAGTVSWPRLVADALQNPQRICAIFATLDPTLRNLAFRVSAALADDVLQAARIAIWRALPKVDLSRSRSIRSMLLTTAYHAMRDEVRREMRQSRVPLEPFLTMRPYHLDEAPRRFGGLLDRYAEYVRQTGSFVGAHRHMARAMGVSIAKTTSDFHRAARDYIEREGLRPPAKKYAHIVEAILSASDETEAA